MPTPARTNLRFQNGVGGIAEASTAPPASGAGLARFGTFLNPANPAFWTWALYSACVLWLVWIRWVYRGAAL